VDIQAPFDFECEEAHHVLDSQNAAGFPPPLDFSAMATVASRPKAPQDSFMAVFTPVVIHDL
jgi:hypothetical protein